MIVMTKQIVGNIDKEYEIVNVKMGEELKGTVSKSTELELIKTLEDELSYLDSDCNNFGKEFSKILLNSNFQLNDSASIEPSLCVDIFDNEDNKQFENLDFEFNVIDALTILSQSYGFVVFNHNSKKIVNNAGYESTSYFQKTEPVFLNMTIAKPLDQLKVVNNSIIVDYEVDDVPYFFELLSIGENSIKLSDFDIVTNEEVFSKLKDKINLEDIRETNKDKVTFKLNSERLGKVSYSISEFFTPLAAALLNRRRLIKGIKESFNLFGYQNEIDTLLSQYDSIEKLGIKSDCSDRWNTSSISKSMFNLKVLDTDRNRIREFLAMLELSPYDEFFELDKNSNGSDKELVKLCYKMYKKNNSNLDSLNSLDKELLLIDLYLMKLVSERVKLDDSPEVIWIPTNYGQETITIKGSDNDELELRV